MKKREKRKVLVQKCGEGIKKKYVLFAFFNASINSHREGERLFNVDLEGCVWGGKKQQHRMEGENNE